MRASLTSRRETEGRNGCSDAPRCCLFDVISYKYMDSWRGFFFGGGHRSLRGMADVTDWPQRRAGKSQSGKKDHGDDGKRETRSCRPCLALTLLATESIGSTNSLWDQNQNLSCVNGKVIVGLCVWDVSAQLRASLATLATLLHAVARFLRMPAPRLLVSQSLHGGIQAVAATHIGRFTPKSGFIPLFRMVSPCHPCMKNEF